MVNTVEQAFELWITEFPESYHPLDQRRFYDFVARAAEADEYIDQEWLAERARQYKHNLTPEQLEDFGRKLDTI